MINLKSIQFQVSSGLICSLQGLKFADTMAVKREGIAFKLAAPTISLQNQVHTINQFERQSTLAVNPDAGISFVKTGGSGISPRTEFFQVGPVVQPGYQYRVYNNNIGFVNYTSTDIDTRATVMTALVFYINGSGLGYTASLFNNAGTTYVKVIMPNATYSLTTSLNFNYGTKYQRGYYVTLNGLDYLILDGVSYTFFPSIPSIPNPINFNNLTLLENGIQGYAYNDQYSTAYYSTFPVGAALINNVPVVTGGSPIDGSTVIVNEANNTLTFQDSFNSETITILHR